MIDPTRIATDHLLSVRRLKQGPEGVAPMFMESTPARELQSWLTDARTLAQPEVFHVKAHTDAQDETSRLNDRADKRAKQGHSLVGVTVLPPLTAWVRDYVMFRADVGYVADNWKPFFVKSMTVFILNSQTPALQQRITGALTSIPETPTFFYMKSTSYLSTKFQYLLRTGLFVTRAKDPRLHNTCPQCRVYEDTDHIFAKCPRYDNFRNDHIHSALKLWKNQARIREMGDQSTELTAKCNEYLRNVIFGTPDRATTFYLGNLLRAPGELGPSEERFAHHMSLTLTSRIAGSYIREVDRELRESYHQTASPFTQRDEDNEKIQ